MMMKKIDPYDPLRRLLKGYGVDGEHLGVALGCCGHTARSRLKEPGTLTVDELRSICIRMGVPADEIRAALRFGGELR